MDLKGLFKKPSITLEGVARKSAELPPAQKRISDAVTHAKPGILGGTDSSKAKHAEIQRNASPEIGIEEPTEHCPECGKNILVSKLIDNDYVCDCGYYFRMNIDTRLEFICDKDSFIEFDVDMQSKNILDFPDYDSKLAKAKAASGKSDAVICGRCTIDGHATAIFIMNSLFMMGSMGVIVGEKIASLFEYATREGLPVVGFTVSGGARMQEGILSLMQMTKVSAAVLKHSDAGGLYIAVLTDPTTGGVTASFAMQADIICAEPGATIGFAGPRVIEQTIRKKLPKDFQTAEFTWLHGFIDVLLERKTQKQTLAKLLGLHKRHTAKFHADGLQLLQMSGRQKDSGPSSLSSSGTSSSTTPTTPSEKITPAIERVKRSRAKGRPTAISYITEIFDDFTELHGDRRFADDSAVVAGIATLHGLPITVISTEKGRNTKERVVRNFGSPNPEGYRKTQRLMKQAEKFNRPVFCLVDTSGAFCGIGAEERGQGQAIAENIQLMMSLSVPVISLIIGEGGSGGALALASADEVWMMEDAIYSVISPEGCSSILFKDAKRVEEAAMSLKLTSCDLQELGVIERIIEEGKRDFSAITEELDELLITKLMELELLSSDKLLEKRYERFRKFVY